MKKYPLALVVALVAMALFLTSCSSFEDSVAPPYPKSSGERPVLSPSSSQATLSNFVVQYDGRVVAGGQTTFSYTVSGTGAGAALSNFVLQIPECAPALDDYSPNQSVSIGMDPNSGLNGIKWNISVGNTNSQSYSITFPGDVPEGLIRTAVKAGTTVDVGVVFGPCQGFEISGTVFVDSNTDGVRNPVDEPGIIADVTVALEASDGSLLTDVTDSNGEYSFRVLDDTYTLRIDFATADDDFNEELGDSFDPTTATSMDVTVGPDSVGNDFGFNPRTDDLIVELEVGDLITTGEGRKFWTRQLRANLKIKGVQVEFDQAQILGFLAQIEGMFFPDPYQFTDGDEIRSALDIITTKSKNPVDQLKAELLATELNEVSGKGLVDDPELQQVLISWGESIIIANSAMAKSSGGRTDPVLQENQDPTLDKALQLFTLMNDRGGSSEPDM